ncbi:ABC transporter ATP-binding protein [Roseovarius indicus]|uniref:ABC transporter ATP-binding protein n=1 Tax=Roseovarius indicus TaxID=540747 RepID=UPI0032EE968C
MALLEVDALTVAIPSFDGWIRPVDDISFEISRGEIVGIVGESGCGKSTTALAIMRLLSESVKTTGSIRFAGEDLLARSEAEMCTLRGNRIAMVFQEPMTALNPVKSIGYQVMEPLLLHTKISPSEARAEAARLLHRVGIDDPERRLRAYPHQLSGGQRQRVVIAMALACKPDLIVADEPTTALDTTVQRQILDLLVELVDETDVALLLITHNLAIVSEIADRVLVMYGGRIAEAGQADKVFANPLHPYAKGLMRALPQPGAAQGERLKPIGGVVPRLADMPPGCPLADRCPDVIPECRNARPDVRTVADDHQVACIRVGGSQ